MEREVLALKEVAAALGVSQRTVARMIQRGQLQPVIVAGTPKITHQELERFLASPPLRLQSPKPRRPKPGAAEEGGKRFTAAEVENALITATAGFPDRIQSEIRLRFMFKLGLRARPNRKHQE